MELSERERRLLREMESHLQVDDPSLASSLKVHRLRVGITSVLAVAGLPIGILLMGLGVWRAHAAGIAIALVGYVVLLASTSVTIEWLRARGSGSLLPKVARKAGPAT
jgi:hypothetical protein